MVDFNDRRSERFITAHELRNMHSGDFMDEPDSPELHRVGGLSANKYPYRNYDWQRLHQDIDQHGMHPLTVVQEAGKLEPTLVNGHHRAVAAMDRGMLLIPHGPDWGPPNGQEGNYRGTRAMTQMLNGHPWEKWHPEGDYLNQPQANPQHRGQGRLF